MLCQYHYKTAVHKVDGPNQGQTYTIPQSGQTQPGSQTYTSPQSGRTPPRVKTSPRNGRTQPGSNLYKSTKWTDPTKGQTYTSPQSERTQPGSQTYINQRSGRTQPGHKIILVHEVDDHTKGHDPIPRNERTQPWSLIQNPQWTNELVSRPMHKVDGPNHCQLI